MLATANGGGLPNGYQEVDFIKGNKAPYIDTNYIPNLYTDFEIIFSNFIESDSGYPSPYGALGGSNAGIGAFIQRGGPRVYTQFGNKVDFLYETSIWRNGTVVTTNQNKNGFWENGSKKVNYADTTFGTPSGSIYLFAINRGGSVERIVGLQIYSVKIRENDVLIRDFIPCYRKSDNKPGLYDLCGSICPLTNSPFYINAGSGEFTVGSDVN